MVIFLWIDSIEVPRRFTKYYVTSYECMERGNSVCLAKTNTNLLDLFI